MADEIKKIKGVVTGFTPLTIIGEREFTVTCGHCKGEFKMKFQVGQKPTGEKVPIPIEEFKCPHCGFGL